MSPPPPLQYGRLTFHPLRHTCRQERIVQLSLVAGGTFVPLFAVAWICQASHIGSTNDNHQSSSGDA